MGGLCVNSIGKVMCEAQCAVHCVLFTAIGGIAKAQRLPFYEFYVHVISLHQLTTLVTLQIVLLPAYFYLINCHYCGYYFH